LAVYSINNSGSSPKQAVKTKEDVYLMLEQKKFDLYSKAEDKILGKQKK
jgi:hypothetical protein